ncbi:MAG: rRNA pseudouridine synthase, partial [Oscillospiraceae bacterium]|nr:rRNA pseudouridine synthase [Oscillospiraceae bacterium]
ATRKEIRQIVKAGRVSVDGSCASAPEQKLDPAQNTVTLDGEELSYRRFRYFAMDKPTGVLTASIDRKQKTVLDLVPEEFRHLALFPVGRLDKDTSGLLLLTNDGEFAHKVISPKYEIPKRYYAETEGVPDERDAEAFARGIELRDGFCCRSAELFPSGGENCEVIVREGKYHQVRRMLAAVGKPVTALRRLSIGALELEKLPLTNGFCELSREQLELIFIK